jgi:hypothetical protein
MTIQNLRAKPPALLSPKEAAIVAGVSASTVQRALKPELGNGKRLDAGANLGGLEYFGPA